MYHMTGLKQTLGIKNVTLKIAKNFVAVAVYWEEWYSTLKLVKSTCGKSNCGGLQIAFSEHCTYMYMCKIIKILFFSTGCREKTA